MSSGIDLAPVATGPRSSRSAARSHRRRRMGDLPVALAFLTPAIVAAVLLRLWPTWRALWDGLHSTPLGVAPTHWVGLDQFRALFGILVNPLQIAAALGIALLFNERLPGVGVMRTIVFLPVAIPASVSAVVWAVALRPEGPLNGVLSWFGIDGLRWLTSPTQALPAIILIVSWIGVGYWMMFLVAGLKDIDPALYEAARVDGAGRWGRFRFVSLPQLRRPLAFVLVADTVSNLLVFAPVQILTQGGPNGRTNLIMNDVYERAYVSGDIGAAGAETVILVLVTLLIVMVQFRLLAGSGD